LYPRQVFLRNPLGDIFGGVTAAVVALPLALAFGISSGAGPVAGLYGAIIVGFFAAVFGGTQSQVSGPTGPMTVVMTSVIAESIALDPQHGLGLAFTTVCLGGLIQSLFGALRLGKYIVMVPYPVISGFMSGIGAIIIVLELGPLLGFESAGSIVAAVRALPQQFAAADAHSLAIGALALGIVFGWRGRLTRLFPAPLLALIGTTAVTLWVLPDASLARIGEISSALPKLQLPTLRADFMQTMLVNALMLAVLGSIDSLLTSLVADNLTGTRHRSDQELMGQGLGNMIAGLCGGLPGAGATMRTVVNIRSGGSGPLSGAVHALVLLAIVTGLGFLFESIPLAALAGILVKVGIDIIDWPFLRRLHRLPPFPIALMALVFLLTVFVDLITAVFVGVFIKNLVTIDKLSDLQLGNVAISDGEKTVGRVPAHEIDMLRRHHGETVLFRVTGPVSYAVGRGIGARFDEFRNRRLLIIDLADASIIGISTTIVIEELVRSAVHSGTLVRIIGLQEDAHQEFRQLGLPELVGRDNCVATIDQAFALDDPG
jgi:SulP family sulfate permease